MLHAAYRMCKVSVVRNKESETAVVVDSDNKCVARCGVGGKGGARHLVEGRSVGWMLAVARNSYQILTLIRFVTQLYIGPA